MTKKIKITDTFFLADLEKIMLQKIKISEHSRSSNICRDIFQCLFLKSVETSKKYTRHIKRQQQNKQLFIESLALLANPLKCGCQRWNQIQFTYDSTQIVTFNNNQQK